MFCSVSVHRTPESRTLKEGKGFLTEFVETFLCSLNHICSPTVKVGAARVCPMCCIVMNLY